VKQNIFTRDLWAMPAFRLLARGFGVYLCASLLAKSRKGFVDASIMVRSFHVHGTDAYFYSTWYALLAFVGLAFILTPPKFWKKPFFAWPLLVCVLCYLLLALIILFRAVK
jgi:hypothetical protein